MRLILALLVIVAGIVAAVFFADHPGAVSLVWQGWRMDTSVGVLVFAVCLSLLVGWVLLRIIGSVLRAPARMAAKRREGRALLGYRAVTDGLVALAAGDVRSAERLRLKAEDHFKRGRHHAPPLTRLLSAQAALLRGDHATARKEFTGMLESPETEFLGLRGLIVQALKEGDDATALSLTERANRLRPNTEWVLQSQLALQTRAGAWRDAQATLADAIKRKLIPVEDGGRHRVALLIALSIKAEGAGSAREALKSALRAHAIDPAFAPAAVRAAALLATIQRHGRAAKLLEATWMKAPHPSIADEYGRLFAALPLADRLKKLERLTSLRTNEPVGHLAAAALALEARLWGEARRHLEAAGASNESSWSRQLCQLMVELEERETSDAVAAQLWTNRCHGAPPDPQWVCESCQASTSVWSPLCPECRSFDTLFWEALASSVGRLTGAPGLPRSILLPVLQLDMPHGRQISRITAVSSGVAAEQAARGVGS